MKLDKKDTKQTIFIIMFSALMLWAVLNYKLFIDLIKFDHLGAFTYSREEGTVSYDYKDQIDEDTKIERYEKLMKKQKVISYQKNKSHIGEVMEGLVVGYDNKNDLYLLRSGWNAPDDIDGNIYIKSEEPLEELSSTTSSSSSVIRSTSTPFCSNVSNILSN